MSLAALLAGGIRKGGSLGVSITPDWLQGRTSYGGLSASIALTAAKTIADDLPPLRSAQIAFVGPLADGVEATPALLRRGKNSAFISCDITGADGIGLRALFLFMAPRTSTIDYSLLNMTLADRPAARLIDGATIGPGFLANFELADAGDRQPGVWRRWVRLKSRKGLAPDIELLMMADALPPAAMSLAKQWGPISTTTWQLNLVTDQFASNDGWWMLEAVTLAAHDGASSQNMTIWNSAGTPVATATQSVALFI